MEEAWEKAEEQERTKQPQFILASGPYVTVAAEEEAEDHNDLGDIFGDIKKTQSSRAYDGELTAMTFNHVKGSAAFASKKYNRFDVDVNLAEEENDFSQWLLQSKKNQSLVAKKSEDGWPRSKRLNQTLSFRNANQDGSNRGNQ